MKVYNKVFYSSGNKIAARVRIPEQKNPSELLPAIVINHGYSGDKNEYDPMAEALCGAGYATLQFDSRGCGKSEAEKGRMMCATEWIEDAYNAVSYILTYPCIDPDRVGFTGCSMGGAVTIAAAATDKRVKSAIAISPVSNGLCMLERNWKKFRGEQAYKKYLKELRQDGLDVANGKASKMVSVPYALGMNAEDEKEYLKVRMMDPEMVSMVPLESITNSFVLFKAEVYAKDIEIPFLILHGDADEIVSIEQSKALSEKIKCQKGFVIVKDGPHPLPMSNKAREVFEHTVAWFDRFL